MHTKRFKLVARMAALVLSATAASTAAAAWPNDQPIRLIVPFTAGGTTDILGRSLAQLLSEKLGQTIVVENKAGAGSMLGSRDVAVAKPDGYTFLLGTTANVLTKYFYAKPLYDLKKDFKPISQMVEIPNFLAINNQSPIKSIKELVQYAQANPGKLSCAHSGVGSSPFVSCEIFKKLANVDILSVAYRGGTQAITDVIGGQASLFFQSEGLPYIQAGQVRPLGVTTRGRSSQLPDVPAIGEAVDGYEVAAWYGVLAPAGLPDDITNRVAAAVQEVMQMPEMRSRLEQIGAEPVGSTPDEFKRKLYADLDYYDALMPSLGIKPE